MLIRALVAVALLSLAGLSEVGAAQSQTSGGQVVHDRLAPVVMHRVFPPYLGVHVYQRSNGRRGR